MNRIQWFVMSWFFFILGFYLIWIHTNLLMPTLSLFNTISGSISAGGVYQSMKTALVYVMILICYPLFILFQILGWLEFKKK